MRRLRSIPATSLFAVMLTGCAVTGPPTAVPTFTPVAGTYTTAQTVTITDTTAGAAIYYTVDGSTPTTTISQYTGPVTVSSSETIKAIALAPSHSLSSIASAAYTITPVVTPPPVPVVTAAPSFSPAGGSFSVAQTVTIGDATSGAVIYYTVDGTVPTTASKTYSSPIVVSTTTTIRAIAVAPQDTPSAVSSATYTITPPSITVNATSFDFGGDLVNTTLTKTIATVTNAGAAAAPLALSIAGDPSFTLVPAQSCAATVAANSSCAIVVAYDPTATGSQTGTVSVVGTTPAASTVSLTGTALAGGTVASTINPQVALYTMTAPVGGSVTVQFGPTTAYGFTTSAQAAPTAGGATGVLVAGMLASSVYHMQATVTLANGETVVDADHSFTTGALPAGIIPGITATTTAGMTPQPGIELIDTIVGTIPSAAVATDLSGNVIWTYPFPDRQASSLLYPIKLMPNGHFIMELDPVSQSIVNGPVPAGTLDVLREIDLAGNTIQELSMTTLNARMIAAGFNITLQVFSHDVTVLPNGHMLVITNTIKSVVLNGATTPTNVVGDVIVDLDTNMNPVWVWNEFDHLDVNRQPMGFPDWTHTNAVVYSQSDGDFIVSVRHQNWVIKVNYNNGAGDGAIVWKLGYQGDFTLVNGTAPQDWFYAQHNPYFFSTNTSGSFSLGLMDNGDDRVFADGTSCMANGGAACYTTVPVMQVDEGAKTATLTFHQILSPSLYSSFAGNTEQLANGNIEYDLAGVGAGSMVYEVTPVPAAPQTVWQMNITGTNTYRVFRMGSLYPGVTW